MSVSLTEGMYLPEFFYDTPFVPQKSFYKLARSGEPLFVIFLANFGHPVTRTYLARYCETAQKLEGCRLAVVVRSKPQVISKALPPEAIPFELICDAEGALYEYFQVPQETSPLKYTSLDAARILRRAKQQGYQIPKGQPQQLPLTLLVGKEGEIMLAHYGRTLTDFPEDGTALERTVKLVPFKPAQPEPVFEAAEVPVKGEFPVTQEINLPLDSCDDRVMVGDPTIEFAENKIQTIHGEWVDNTQQILLDFTHIETDAAKEPVPSPDLKYNTTGEIDIVGLKARIGKGSKRAHNRLEDTLTGFEEIKL